MSINYLFVIPGLGMIAVALIFIIYWRRKSLSPWFFFLWGGLAWFVAIVLKAGFAIPLNRKIIGFLDHSFPSDLASPLSWIYIGLLTGVFECGITLLFAMRRSIKGAIWKNVVAFGIGFGSIEALLVGMAALVGFLAAILVPTKLPPQVLAQFQASGIGLLVIPAPIIERIAAILLHTFSCILIIYALRMRKWGWFWLSFIYKTGIDSLAACGHFSHALANLGHLWLLESVAVIFGLLGIWGIYFFSKKYYALEHPEKRIRERFAPLSLIFLVIVLTIFIVSLTCFGMARDYLSYQRIRDRYSEAIFTPEIEEYDQVIKEYQEFISKYPKSKWADNAQMHIGESYEYQNNYAQALKEYQEVISRYPNSDRLDAVKLKVEIIENNPSEILRLYSDEYRAWQGERYEEAVKKCQEIIDNYPESNLASHAQYFIASMYDRNLRKTDRAFKEYNKLIKNYPDSRWIERAKGRVEIIRSK